jgi:hypothetical protein
MTFLPGEIRTLYSLSMNSEAFWRLYPDLGVTVTQRLTSTGRSILHRPPLGLRGGRILMATDKAKSA